MSAPSASTPGAGATATRAQPTAALTPPIVVGARGPFHLANDGAMSSESRKPPNVPLPISPRTSSGTSSAARIAGSVSP